MTKLYSARQRHLDHINREREINIFLDNLLKTSIELGTFKEKKTIAFRVETFLEEIIKDVFFSIYVPNNQIFSEQFEDFLKIFEKYLQNIEGVNFSVDIQTSSQGKKFYFKSRGEHISKNEFPFAVKRFNDFIELCTISPDEAMEMIKVKFPNPSQALEIIQSFSKKYNRLSIDLKHQQQRLQLMLKQDIENSLLEINIQGTATFMFEQNGLIKDSISYVERGFTMPSFNSNLTKEELEIISIASEFNNGAELVQIKSNLEILKDRELSTSEKQTAIDKIKSFLIKSGKEALTQTKDIGIKVLTTYLEGLVNGQST